MASTDTNTNKTCQCGCGASVARKFLPGHDARLKSRLLHEAAWGVTVGKRERAMHELMSRNWAHFLGPETLGFFVFRARDSKGRYCSQVHLGELLWGDVEAHYDTHGTTHSNANCTDLDADRHAETCSSCVRTHDVFELVGLGKQMAA